ncbi:MAG TPA: DUF4190 domain-containing protein [Polyangiaceae bacterium]|nr:DUF4190 domain-containing protein [Polyangiaceae bacterium]
MPEEQNPYSPAIVEAEPLVEQIRRRSTWAAALGAAGLLCGAIFAPAAVYLGHQCLGRIHRQQLGLEHRGAALAGAILGWLGSVYLVVAVMLLVSELLGS